MSLSDVETGSPTTLSCLPQVLTTGLLIPMQATPCPVTQAQKCLLSTSLPSCSCMEVFAPCPFTHMAVFAEHLLLSGKHYRG